MHRFEYRVPRRATSFSVDFMVGDNTLHGLCRDVSEAGIRAEFDGLVHTGTTGILVLRHPASVIKLDAQVAYADKGQVGLSFVFHAAHERVLVVRFLAVIANAPTRALFGKSP